MLRIPNVTRRLGPTSRALALATACGAAACGENGPLVAFPEVGEVVVEPSEVTLFVFESLALGVRVLDAGGNPIPGRAVDLWSDNDNVASVSAYGLVTANLEGAATISARSGGVTARVPVRVRSRPVTTIRFQPPTYTHVGWSHYLDADALDAEGHHSGRRVTIRSADDKIARVRWVESDWWGSYAVLAISEGEVELIAEAEGVSTRVTLTVAPALLAVYPRTSSVSVGDTVRLHAAVVNEQGALVSDAALSTEGIRVEIEWQSSDPARATVDSDGWVRGLMPGTAQVFAGPRGPVGPSFTRSASSTLTIR